MKKNILRYERSINPSQGVSYLRIIKVITTMFNVKCIESVQASYGDPPILLLLFSRREMSQGVKLKYLRPSSAKVKKEYRYNSTYRYVLVMCSLKPYIIQHEMKANYTTIVL